MTVPPCTETSSPEAAAVAETHASVVFFVGDLAYKLKKPVALGFLDHTTPEGRRAACHEEVRLNRRLAPDVYLGVSEVRDPNGEVCDHLVVMRRMPAARRLSILVSSGADVDECLWQIARRVAAFHAAAPTSPAMAATGTAAAVRARWDDNVRTIAAFAPDMVDEATLAEVIRLATRYLEGRVPLFERRIALGRIRDGHGDLLADDIFCLDDGPRILDCIEFDERLRVGDVLADVAFLAMDLERLGEPGLAARCLAYYRALSADTWPASLADHYIAYRAGVRAKVACVRHAQGAPVDESPQQLLALARTHLERGRMRLVLVGGVPGTGKSTLAVGLANAGVGAVVASDDVRKSLAGLDPTTPCPAGFEEGLYRPEHSAATYRELMRRAETMLGLGESVIVDATWADDHWRAEAGRVAEGASADLVELRCVAPAEVAASRIASRARASRCASDATPEIATALAARFAPWPSAFELDLAVDPAGALDQALAAVPGGRERAGPEPADHAEVTAP